MIFPCPDTKPKKLFNDFRDRTAPVRSGFYRGMDSRRERTALSPSGHYGHVRMLLRDAREQTQECRTIGWGERLQQTFLYALHRSLHVK